MSQVLRMKFASIFLLFAAIAAAEGPAAVHPASDGRLSQAIFTSQTEGCREALPLLMEIMQQEPENAAAWFQLGMCRGKVGEQAAKVEAMERAVALRPADNAARHQLILALRILGRDGQARDQVKTLAETNPALAQQLARLLQDRAAPVQTADSRKPRSLQAQ